MKKLATLLIAFTTFSATAGVITCSNNPNSPGQYTDLQLAIDNANANDTILIQGSSTAYNTDITIQIPLTLMGAGFNNPNGGNTTLGRITLGRANPSVGASGTTITGIQFSCLILQPSFTGGNATNQIISDITLDRCRLYGGALAGTTYQGIRFQNYTDCAYNNFNIKNCYIIGKVFTFDNYPFFTFTLSNFTFNNCYFTGASEFIIPAIADLSPLAFVNCFFHDNMAFVYYQGSSGDVVFGHKYENCIFYNAKTEGCVNCVYDNNLTYGCTNDALIDPVNPGSSGGGNVVGQDPLFVNYPIGGGAFSYAHDYNLQVGSPAIGTGTAGTDVGIHGGVSPMQIGLNPSIPQMQTITTPLGTTVSQGTNLNVTFKTYKQD